MERPAFLLREVGTLGGLSSQGERTRDANHLRMAGGLWAAVGRQLPAWARMEATGVLGAVPGLQGQHGQQATGHMWLRYQVAAGQCRDPWLAGLSICEYVGPVVWARVLT